ncbi:MAG: hypothetical protein H6865_03015 [Rhodospirillales bacterium]|nr:hypothetical protein [Alphaproteobacteria bacterium]MCB9986588.1 hypothetical protein [Rhodospirillales bacterium]USO06882.1 MAG: hypothetical protein H6866_05370 [Rhodospirillales bacterium]
MAVNISTLASQTSLIDRVKQVQVQMSEYQQQITTGVKHQTFKDYGADGLRIQRYRADLASIDGYTYNIDSAQVNIDQMNSAISENIDQAGNILQAISVQLARGSDFDVEGIKSAARTALQVIEANMNAKVGDRYLFAGSDVSVKPYSGAAAADNGVQARVSDWLDGTVTTDQFLDGINNMTDSQSGYSTSLQSAKKVFARADDQFEVDYTVLANSPGFKKVVNAIRAIANIQFPSEGTDVPTKDNFYDALNSLYAQVQSGVNDLRNDSTKIASASQQLNVVKQNHLDDKQNLQQILENTEAADTTDAVVKFQTLQTQLQASYQVTSILSQLSLARYLYGG